MKLGKKNISVLDTSRQSVVLGFAALAFLALAISAQATNIVTNGGFELTTNGPNLQFDYLTQATGWTSTNANSDAYNFIFAPGAADTTGATGQFGNLQLWGPNNGSNSRTTSPIPVYPAWAWGSSAAKSASTRP